MRIFNFEKEYSKLLTPDIVSYITQIHEYRGRYSADNIQKELQINLQSHSLQPTKNMIPYSL